MTKKLAVALREYSVKISSELRLLFGFCIDGRLHPIGHERLKSTKMLPVLKNRWGFYEITDVGLVVPFEKHALVIPFMGY